MIALVGAMFVAIGSASAQSTMYICKANPENGDALEVFDGTNFVTLNAPDGVVTSNETTDANGDDCETEVSPDRANAEAGLVAGDVINKVEDDFNSDGTKTFRWEWDYKFDLGMAKSDETNVLLLDNPDNPKSGTDDGDARPQSMTIPASVADFEGEEGDTVESTDKSGTIVMVSDRNDSTGWTITAGKAGTVTLTFTDMEPAKPSVITTYTFEVKEGMSAADQAKADAAAAETTERSVTLEIDDTDDTVGNAVTGSYPFTITTQNIPVLPDSAGDTVPHIRVYVSGELEDAFVQTRRYSSRDEDGELIAIPQTLEDGKTTYTGDISVPKGTTPGEYTLDVTIYTDGSTSRVYGRGLTGFKGYSGSDVLIVGDAGSNVSEAVLVLSPLNADGDPVAEGTSQKTQLASSAAKGDPIRLTLTSLNALGNPSNTTPQRISVTVTAAGATIKHSHSVNAKGAYVAADGRSGDNSLQFYSNAASVVVEITKDTPGEVEVSALVVDPVGSGYDGSDTVSLTFTGPAKTVSLSDATTTLLNRYVDHKADDDDTDTDPRDNISLKLTASDADGHAVVPTGSATVTIAGPDGSMVATDGAGQKIVVSQKVTGTANTISLQVAASVTAASPLKSGEYTVTAKDGARKDTATFTVVGLADTVSMEASEADEDGQIEVTVTVTDADGNHVADGTAVEVMAADLRGDSDPVILRTSTTGKTKAGVAKATFIEVGYGPAAIIATADGKTDVVRVTSTFDAPVPEAMPEEEASVSCLSELSGFATWSCGVEADASEIFDMVAGRGVTAIHLWNGSTWVRYSVVDGAMVPGSSDFMVTENDILYISN